MKIQRKKLRIVLHPIKVSFFFFVVCEREEEMLLSLMELKNAMFPF
jgi:hypothetical protein